MKDAQTRDKNLIKKIYSGYLKDLKKVHPRLYDTYKEQIDDRLRLA